MSEAEGRLVRDELVDYLEAQYLGPAGGAHESLRGRPEYTYLVGTLYPQGPAERSEGGSLGEDGSDEELDQPIELANAWQPASAAVSFLLEGDKLSCAVRAGTYAKEPGESTEGGDGESGATWARSPEEVTDLLFSSDDSPSDRKEEVFDGRARVVTVWRPLGARWLVTVAVENLAKHDTAEGAVPTESCLFQVELVASAVDGGRMLPYRTVEELSDDPEDEELRLLYRDRRVYGVGHGCSVRWDVDADGEVRTVGTDMLPRTAVPAVRAAELPLDVLTLGRLCDEDLDRAVLCAELNAFVDHYENWVSETADGAEELEPVQQVVAARLLERMRRAESRMREGIDLLARDDVALLAFRLANRAMREQILQTRHVRTGAGLRKKPLAARPAPTPEREPRWYPFQLGFQLLALCGTADARHADRGTTDLIWFPTGGGKTEAYLALAAFEMIRRRLTRGIHGGGTAVLTRYTLRLLTTQQFQRAATLVCALELLREEHPRLRGTPSFSIGMWVGGDTTPNSFERAHALAVRLRKSQTPESPYQIQACPWCGTALFPSRHDRDTGAYGVRSQKHSFELHCPHAGCRFHALLPVLVVDEQMFKDPPTLVIATVDKFARLPWVEEAGALLGRANVPYDPPSLVIQDELHLLSGPLGTTVAIYEAALQALLGWDGTPPKIVASTATIRSADEQVRELFASDVALFPPSGLDADDSFFARTDREAPGRLYLGLMPQAFSASFATVLACTALLQAPRALALPDEDLDAYWTLVAYHNSLRELGRTVTSARDDVNSMLTARRRADTASRVLRRDGIVELTSNVQPAQLVQLLARLERSVQEKDSVDLVATTNMLSVGIDISRLGVMLMNGQPKTTAEYIQATSRVGRGQVPGLVVTLFRSSKPRDRSHYEGFRAYHDSLYRYVEPTSVTPWSAASRERSLSAALTLLVRHGVGLSTNEGAGDFRSEDPAVKRAVARLLAAAERADPDEAEATEGELVRLVKDWDRRARSAEAGGERLKYQSPTGASLLKDFGQRGEGWATMHSMRSVDRQVRVLAVGERL